MADATIRRLRADDGDAVRTIELAAGERFRDVGLAFVAEHDPATLVELEAYASSEHGWVATKPDDAPIAYVLVDVVDRNAHIEQVSVHPAHQGSGVGRALVEHVHAWAVDTRRPAITLTTFRDVDWNRPLYEHLGFTVMTDDEIGPELAAICRTEATHGLAPELRVCMRRFVV